MELKIEIFVDILLHLTILVPSDFSMELMLFIDSEVLSPVHFVCYSWYNAGFEGEILDILIIDGCILFYSDKDMWELVITSFVSC